MNRRVLVSRLVAMFCAAGLLRSSRADSQESTARDGTWWQQLPTGDRLIFVVGFMDGMDLGKDFSFWGFTDSAKNCLSAVYDSYTEMETRYFSNVTAGQLRDGLNDFYSDYRNRSIRLPGAAWLVVQGIAGVPKDKLEKSIESWRRSASQTN